ncbi:MAG TPA: hypothetical protein VG454_09445 [Gemmatimonadales bacterium]|nr:hypothetical protein [Gemmatimonadales bacterium]
MACARALPSSSQDRVAVATAERDRFCDEEVEQAAAVALRAVQSADPLYVTVSSSKGSYQALLLGARLWLPAHQGVTPQWLERTLRCHQARLALQPPSTGPALLDPFWLPDGWIDIDVVAERGGFIVVLRGDSVARGQQIYARAQAFVAKAPNER